MFEIKYFSDNNRFDQLNKDSIYIHDHDDRIICSIADGVNSKKLSKLGAMEVQNKLVEYTKSALDTELLDVVALRIKFTMIIKETLHDLSKRDNEVLTEYASTLIFLVILKNQSKGICVHIGDGILISQDENHDVNILSYPQNGISEEYTYTTVYKNLYDVLNINVIPLNKMYNIYMMSDGAANPFYKKCRFTQKGKNILISGLEDVKKSLESIATDDYSVIQISKI